MNFMGNGYKEDEMMKEMLFSLDSIALVLAFTALVALALHQAGAGVF